MASACRATARTKGSVVGKASTLNQEEAGKEVVGCPEWARATRIVSGVFISPKSSGCR